MNKDTKIPAQEKWVNLYADQLFGYAIERLADKDLAMDFVQETFLTALEKQEQFKENSKFSTWLTSILKNKIIDFYRKKSNFTDDIEDQYFDEKGMWKTEYQNADHLLKWINEEEKADLTKCIQKLPSSYKSVIKMKYFIQMAGKDICKELNLSSSNYWTMIHRAKLNLKKCLERLSEL